VRLEKSPIPAKRSLSIPLQKPGTGALVLANLVGPIG